MSTSVVSRASRFAPVSAIGVLVASLALGGALFAIGGVGPLMGFRALVEGAFGSGPVVGETLIRATPVAIVAIGLIPSLKAGLFNIGSPGQIGMGGLLSTMVSLHVGTLPSPVAWTLAAAAGIAGGALWVVIPALLRARLGINEILTTLVFNFLALYLLGYLLSGPLQGASANLAQSESIPASAELSILIPDSRAHIAILLALLITVGMVAYLKTASGYRLELFGANKELARHGGVHESRITLTTMLVGGGAAGLAGWAQVAGVDHRLYATVADPVGYYGFFAAILGLLLPVVVLVAAFGIGALLQGGGSLQIGVGVAPEIIEALIGLVLFLVAVRSSFTPLRKGR